MLQFEQVDKLQCTQYTNISAGLSPPPIPATALVTAAATSQSAINDRLPRELTDCIITLFTLYSTPLSGIQKRL
jgi:hypothetical protein